jgi:ATP-dependent Clp protease ATP-binding subunit ClpA
VNWRADGNQTVIFGRHPTGCDYRNNGKRPLEIEFDEKIVFRPLSPDTQREIGRLAICQELDRLSDRGFKLTVSEAAFEFLVRRGIQKTLGARPMKRTVQKFIGDAIRQALKSNVGPSGILVVDSSNNQLSIREEDSQ